MLHSCVCFRQSCTLRHTRSNLPELPPRPADFLQLEGRPVGVERQCQGIFSSSCSSPSRCAPTIPHAAPGPETPTPWHTGVVCYARFWHRAYSPRMPHFSAAGGLGARADDVRGGGRVAATAPVSPAAKLRAAAARAPVLCSARATMGCNLGVQLPRASERWLVACSRGWTACADRCGPRAAAGACLTATPACARTCSRGKGWRGRRRCLLLSGGSCAARIQAEPARAILWPQHAPEAVSLRMPAARTRCGRAGAACVALHRAARRFGVS